MGTLPLSYRQRRLAVCLRRITAESQAARSGPLPGSCSGTGAQAERAPALVQEAYLARDRADAGQKCRRLHVRQIIYILPI